MTEDTAEQEKILNSIVRCRKTNAANLLGVPKSLQTFLASANRAPCHAITIQATGYDVIIIKLDARNRAVVTIKRLETEQTVR